MNGIKRAQLFYGLICLAGFLIILLPVGIANIIFGYGLGDAPCTLCWGQRESMIFIGVMAFFIVRYGLKFRYVAMLLIMAATGLYESFRHVSNHAMRDVGQGFGVAIFGIHTQFWAEVVFWCVVLMLGVMFFFAPKVDAFVEEMKGRQFRALGTGAKAGMMVSAAIIASNVFQAFVSTGIPPYWGQGSPARFTLNPQHITWEADAWNGLWSNFSFRGKRDVAEPDYAFAKSEAAKASHNAAEAPVAVDSTLSVVSDKALEIKQAVNSVSRTASGLVLTSDADIWLVDDDGKVTRHAKVDPYYDTQLTAFVGAADHKGALLVMGSNKSWFHFQPKDGADPVKGFANFLEGADQFESIGKYGRGRVDTERAKYNYVHSVASDGKYVWLATVPNKRHAKNFVVSKVLAKDMTLSGEFVPEAELKEGRGLGELYVTGAAARDGKLYFVSRAYNVLLEVDPASEKVTRAMGLPAELADIRGLAANADGSFTVVNANHLVTLK